MTKIKNLYGLILAGGFSKRMGQNKALMVYHGKPQIEYVNDLLAIHCEKVFLSKRPDQLIYKNISCIDDTKEFVGMGPLGGILSAMQTFPEASWLIMACDLPFVTNETLKELIKDRDDQKTATAFKSNYDDLPEPLCAIWEANGYSKVLEFFKKGILCPRKVLINSHIKLIEQKNSRWLDNVNDPKEFESALDHLKN